MCTTICYIMGFTVKCFFDISILRNLVSDSACVTKSLQSRPALGDPLHYCLPGSFGHESLQARILEWVAMPSTSGSSQFRDLTCVAYVSCMGRQVLYECHLGSQLKQYHIMGITGFRDSSDATFSSYIPPKVFSFSIAYYRYFKKMSIISPSPRSLFLPLLWLILFLKGTQLFELHEN